jgi:hypothetical protein
MYLDSAIIVKLVVREPDSLFYTQELQGKTGIWTSGLAMTECYSALCRKEREKAVTRSVRNTAWAKIEEFIENGGIGLVTPTQGILANANRVIELCHPAIVIRSLDATWLPANTRAPGLSIRTTSEFGKPRNVSRFRLGPFPLTMRSRAFHSDFCVRGAEFCKRNSPTSFQNGSRSSKLKVLWEAKGCCQSFLGPE